MLGKNLRSMCVAFKACLILTLRNLKANPSGRVVARSRSLPPTKLGDYCNVALVQGCIDLGAARLKLWQVSSHRYSVHISLSDNNIREFLYLIKNKDLINGIKIISRNIVIFYSVISSPDTLLAELRYAFIRTQAGFYQNFDTLL